MNQNIQDASKSYSQIYNAPHHTASSQQSSSTSTLLSHQHLYKQRNDDDVLPPPPPEAYSDSENQHIHPSNTKINCSRREFLQTLNAKLSVFQNQRLSPKLVKRRSMSLPHSDQEWDSDSGITSQSTSSNKSSPRGSTSSHSESFSQSFTERLGTYGSRNSNNCNNIYQSDGTKNRNNSVCHKNQNQNTNNNSHSTYASFLYSEADVKNVPQNFGYSDSDNVNDHSLSKMKMNSSQHSEVAKAAATEAIRRKKSQSECSLESNIRESNSQINPESHQSSASASENTSSNCMDRIYRSHQHYLSHYNHQHHPSNPFHQNYASENMQTENVYTTRNQSVYQSTSNPTSACFSESLPNHYQQKSISQPAMSTLSKNRQIPIGHPLSSGNCSTGNNIDTLQTAANKNEIIRDQVDMNGRSQSSSVPGESQHIQKNSGDIPSCVDENNRAGSEGSITPTNPDRNSPTYESSKSTVLSYIKREPVQLSALKSTKSYPGSHLAESLYSSTGTLSRLGKPAPPPPVRKTSSISDPNAITLGTLRSAGVSTYEEIKTLKRHSRNRSGGSSFNTYEELNSDKNAIYYAARKSCLSTSLTSLVEPIYSTLDSNNTGTANYYDSKSVTVNTLGNQEKQDASKSYSQIYNAPHHPASSQQSSSTSTLLSHQHLYKQRNDDDVLPPPPPEAYSDSENQHIHPSNTKINCSRREFLQTLNAKLSVFQNQRLSPKLAKRRSMSLPHSDQEWDSDSGITSHSTSSNKSSPRGSTSSHSESFAQSLVKRLSAYGGRNSNSNSVSNGSQVDSSRSRAHHGNNQSNTNNNSHAIYSSFFFGRNKAGESDSKNVPQNYGHGDVDDYSLSKMKMNSSQHSEVAKAAATEAIRRKKSQSECSLESNLRESNSQINPESHQSSAMHDSASENSSSNCMDRIYRSHQHYLSHYNHQHHPSNPFHQNYASENMQTENVYTTRNQSVYQSTSNQPNAYLPGPYSGSHANHQQKIYSQTAMYSAPNSYLNNNGYNPPKGPNNNTMSRSDIGSSVSSSSVEQSQHIQENSGDILSESNRACSEGSITPTNPDRNSPTYESSKSTVLSYIKREPVQLSALKSTKSYPGSHLAESLYSSTGTLSRLGKPAPPPPVRKTSSISDPNAITLGTLRSAGVSTYEEIKTLKRNSRNRNGGSSFNTYEELNSDKNAIYYAARKSCLSTSLTSLVEPIYSTLDSNNTGTANYYDTKSVTVNSLGNQEKQDSSKPYSQIQDPKQHPTSSVAFTVF